MQSSKDLTPGEYNEPIYYCSVCHSACIKIEEALADDDWDGSYCGKCHSPHISEGPFGDWLAEEERREEKRRIQEWKK